MTSAADIWLEAVRRAVRLMPYATEAEQLALARLIEERLWAVRRG